MDEAHSGSVGILKELLRAHCASDSVVCPTPAKLTITLSGDTFELVMDVNLLGTMRVCTACRRLMAKQGGSIVNIASMLSFFGAGLAPAYSASKGAVAQLTKSLAIAWAPDRIRVNALAPGWITTSFTQRLQDDPTRFAEILRRTPLKRWGRPEDLVGPALFLCSPAAAFITGAVLPVDGGYLIT